MLLSCKLSHLAIQFLERAGAGTETAFDAYGGPIEFLRDPTSWLESDQMERFLGATEAVVLDHWRTIDRPQSEPPLTAMGHLIHELRAWGVLDSVLRMVQTPRDLFSQPERLLSYFISPAPPIGNVRRGDSEVRFVLPVAPAQIPRTAALLKAALEALPGYINHPHAKVDWTESELTISWSEPQSSLLAAEDERTRSFDPELVRTILNNLESSQRQIEEMKRELHERDEELRSLRSQIAQENQRAAARSNPAEARNRVASELSRHALRDSLDRLYRLNDYWGRSQQLITLLVGQGRASPQVQEAMRRVDWTRISQEAPETVKQAISSLQTMEGEYRS